MSYGYGYGFTIQRRRSARPLRFAAQAQRISALGVPIAVTSSRRAIQFERNFVIASGNYKRLRLLILNWGWSGSSEIGCPNPLYIDKIAIQNSARTVTSPLTISGGRTGTVPAGALEFAVDDMLPSLLSVSEYAETSLLRIRGFAHLASDSDVFMGVGVESTNFTAYTYNPDTTTPVVDVDANGALSGTGLTGSVYMPAMVLVGEPVSGDPVVVAALGDSIGYSQNDTSSAASGLGFIFRGCVDADRVSNPRACLNLSYSGRTSGQLLAASRSLAMLKYANTLITQPGTNDVVLAVAAATTQANLSAIWAAARAAGIRKIAHAQTMAYCTSSNSFVDAPGQTPVARWGAGQEAATLRAWVASRVGSEIDAVIAMDSTCDPGDRTKWITTGVANQTVNADGLHPNTYTHVIAGTETRGVLATFD